MRKQRIYISGAMTAPTQDEQARNVQAFHDCALLINSHTELKAVNPARVWACRFKWLYKAMERLLGEDGAYRTVLLYDLWLLSRSDSICMIDGWQQSRGAKIEEGFAFRLGIVRSHTYDPEQRLLMPFQKGKKKRKLDEQQPVSEAAAAVAALGNAMSRMGGSNKKNELIRNK